jgi:isopentenyl-diphosphate delta-isomerase
MSDYHSLVKSLGSKEILALFPEVLSLKAITGKPTSAGSSSNDEMLQGHDEEQIKLMEELCIVLDYKDQPVGAGTKKLCHVMDNIQKGLLHRAFSVFLFNDEGKLLLQQRATEKITFADMWTNTCCSHPLAVDSEMGQGDLQSSVQGARVAAQRKLEQELGIKPEYVPLEDFKFLTRIHYMAPSNGAWGEHEIDYIFIIRANPELVPNANEVRDLKYVSSDELKAMFMDNSLVFTPWFKLICESYLFKWWGELNHLNKFESSGIDRLL